MALRINTNIAALKAHRLLSEINNGLRVTVERLPTGYLINRARDDVADLGIANKFRMEVHPLRSAQQKMPQAQSLLQIAKWGTEKIKTIIERLKELDVFTASSYH